MQVIFMKDNNKLKNDKLEFKNEISWIALKFTPIEKKNPESTTIIVNFCAKFNFIS